MMNDVYELINEYHNNFLCVQQNDSIQVLCNNNNNVLLEEVMVARIRQLNVFFVQFLYFYFFVINFFSSLASRVRKSIKSKLSQRI